MVTYQLKCDDPDHASRKGKPGYQTVLGKIELPDGTPPPDDHGHICDACATARREVQAEAEAISTERINELADLQDKAEAYLAGDAELTQDDRDRMLSLYTVLGVSPAPEVPEMAE